MTGRMAWVERDAVRVWVMVAVFSSVTACSRSAGGWVMAACSSGSARRAVSTRRCSRQWVISLSIAVSSSSGRRAAEASAGEVKPAACAACSATAVALWRSAAVVATVAAYAAAVSRRPHVLGEVGDAVGECGVSVEGGCQAVGELFALGVQAVVGGVGGAQACCCGVAGVFGVGLFFFQEGELFAGRSGVGCLGEGVGEVLFEAGAVGGDVGQRGVSAISPRAVAACSFSWARASLALFSLCWARV